MFRTRRDAPIVVGVDGTDASRAALIFALREGVARGSTVEVVTAWESQDASDAAAACLDVRTLAQGAQDQVVAEALTDARSTPVISRVLVEENPATALVSASRGAAFLVIGRGRKGVVRNGAVGSISEYCIRHAHCPVAVVPPDGADEDQPETSVLSVSVPTG